MGEFLPVVRVIGLVLVLFSGTMALPLALSWALDDGAQHAYDEAIVATLAAGVLLSAVTWRHQRELKVRDGYLIVVFSWTLLPLFAAIPLLIYLPTLSFTDAYFECMSGLTTTGATVLSNLDRLPPSINVWRAQMHWGGGLGHHPAGGGDSSPAGRRRAPVAQGGGAGTDERHQAHAAHRRDRQRAMEGLYRIHPLVLAGFHGGRARLDRSADPHLQRHGAGRLFLP
jgi:hypothetical protein